MREPGVQLVEIGSDEVMTLLRISIQAFREAFTATNTPGNMEAYIAGAFTRERLGLELDEPNSRWFFAKVDREVVGYLKLNLGPAQTEFQDPKALEIERIYVLEEYLGDGIGAALLDLAIRTAKLKNLTYIWLGVWERNPRAIRFYEKNGFVRFGEHPFRMGDDVQTDWLMRRAV